MFDEETIPASIAAKVLRLRAMRLSQTAQLEHEADRRAMLSREWERSRDLGGYAGHYHACVRAGVPLRVFFCIG